MVLPEPFPTARCHARTRWPAGFDPLKNGAILDRMAADGPGRRRRTVHRSVKLNEFNELIPHPSSLISLSAACSPLWMQSGMPMPRKALPARARPG